MSITFIYCVCICCVIFCPSAISFQNDDYTNDSPEITPKIETARHKIGSDIKMRCNDHHHKKDNITWEFMRCQSNYKGVLYEPEVLYKLDNGNEWKKLDYNKGRKKLEINNSNEEDTGLYRCLYNKSIIKIYVLDIIVPAKYKGPPPEVVSVIPTNTTIPQTSHLVIQCKIHSFVRPEIRFFKECNGKRCDIYENDFCYCSIPVSNNLHSLGHNLYMSKLNIYNVRDIDSGVYACLAISVYGKDYKNVFVLVQGSTLEQISEQKSFSLLFLIPLGFVLVPVVVWLCYYKKKNTISTLVYNEHQKQLIKPVDNVTGDKDIV